MSTNMTTIFKQMFLKIIKTEWNDGTNKSKCTISEDEFR